MNILQESPTLSPPKRKNFKVAFIGTSVAGVMKYRLGNFAWQMRKFPGIHTVLWPYAHNITIQNPWQVDMVSRHDIMQEIDKGCSWADVVVWQTLDFPHSYELWESMKMRHQKPFLMEIDDYFMDVPPTNEAHDQYRPGTMRSQVALEQMRHSDAIVVSTPYLKELYKDYHDRIYVVPNSIDFSEWKGLETKRHDRLRIGWIGGGTHSADLEMVQPVIDELTQKYKDVWFYCIHGCPQVYKTMPKVYWTKRWAKINLYPKFMASYKFDIGIAPLEDNNFNRGKSNLRYLEYSALKLPSVSSPLPDFVRSIEQGKTGFLASDLEAWKQHLEELIQNEGLRRDMGKKAYQNIHDNFNVTKTANLYRHILQEFL